MKNFIKHIAIITTLFITFTSCSNSSEKSSRTTTNSKATISKELKDIRSKWREAIINETTPDYNEPPAAANLPKMFFPYPKQEEKYSSRFISGSLTNKDLDGFFNNKYGFQFAKPLNWSGGETTIGWHYNGKNISYGNATFFVEHKRCVEDLKTNKLRGGSEGTVNTAKYAFRGRNQISLREALFQEIKVIQESYGANTFAIEKDLYEFKISNRPALGIRIRLENLDRGECSKSQVWDFITTKSYYNRDVMVMVMNRDVTEENFVTDEEADKIIFSVKKSNPKYLPKS